MPMKKKTHIILLIICIGILVAYEFRIYIATLIWHMRHGTSLAIGGYSVTVPNNWYVENIDGVGQHLFRLNTDDHTPTKRLKVHASILMQEVPPRLSNDRALALKKSLAIEAIKKHGEPVLQ